MIPFKEGSVNLIALFVILGPIIGIILTIFFWVSRSGKNRANIYLGFLVLQFSLYLLPSFFYVLGLLDDFPHVIKLGLLGSFMIGPLTYFYVRKCTQKEFELRPKLLVHFIPAVIDFIYHIPYFTLSGSEKIEYYINFFVQESFTEPLFIQVSKAIQILIYCFVSIRIVLKYKDHISNSSSYIDATFHRWLLFFCSTLFIPILTGVLFTFFKNSYGIVSIPFLLFTPFAFIMSVFFLVLYKPNIFMVFPHQMLIPDSTEEKTQKYESSNLKDEQKEIFLTRLLDFVNNKKPYLSPELTLSELANQVDIPTHYLSQVINEKMECNFLDFVNSYRVEEAKDKLRDSAFSHFTILAIAYEVGFNSKTAFYSAFKKHSGTTPSSFRKSLKVS